MSKTRKRSRDIADSAHSTTTEAELDVIGGLVCQPVAWCFVGEAAARPADGGIVKLNVGGKLFLVQESTLLGRNTRTYSQRLQPQQSGQRGAEGDASSSSLCTSAGSTLSDGGGGGGAAAEPSGTLNFFDRLLRGDAAVPFATDKSGAVLIDRDPLVFHHIVNYLRGYRLQIPDGLKRAVASDALYFGLTELATMLEPRATLPLSFEPGPGVSPDGGRFRSAYTVAFIGSSMLTRGRHTIELEVQSSEYLGIGVASDYCTTTDAEIHKTTNCCVYYMTGVFYSNFPGPRKEEGLMRFAPGDTVTMILDMDARTLEYTVRGAYRMVSVKSAQRLRFAVTQRSGSSTRILRTSSSAE